MKNYRFEKLYFLLFIVVAFLVAGIATAGFAVTLGCRGFVTNDVDSVVGLDNAHSVAISPDGNSLYAVGSLDNAVAVFSRDNDETDTPGALDFVQMYQDNDNLNQAISVIVSPDGDNVYVASHNADTITVFERDISDGTLGFIEVKKDGVSPVDGLDGITSITFSPDGNNLYAISDLDNAVTTFSLDNDGKLIFYDVIKDNEYNGTGIVDGLEGGWSLTVSPDGNHLYTAGYSDDDVALFNRNPAGELSFETAYNLTIDNDENNPVYFGPSSLVVSPDGKQLYVAGYDENSVVVFNRNETSGQLTYVEKQLDGIGDVDGLAGAFYVGLSPDGKYFYVIGLADDSVVMFKRSESDGKLTFLEMQQDEFNCNGLDWATSLAVSSDGKHLYATGASDDAIAIFSILYTPAELDAERSKWDANDDNKIGLEEAIQALRITSGL